MEVHVIGSCEVWIKLSLMCFFICILLDTNFEQLSESNEEYNQPLDILANEMPMLANTTTTEGALTVLLVGYINKYMCHIFRPMHTCQ